MMDGSMTKGILLLVYGAHDRDEHRQLSSPETRQRTIQRSSGADPYRCAGRPQGIRLYRNADWTARSRDSRRTHQVLRTELHAPTAKRCLRTRLRFPSRTLKVRRSPLRENRIDSDIDPARVWRLKKLRSGEITQF